MNARHAAQAEIYDWNRAYEATDRPAALLAEYIHSVEFAQLPSSVVDVVIELIEDNVGCALGALAMAETSPLLLLSAARHPSDRALAIGANATSVDSAVFCNASLANWLDFDDMHHYFLPYHLGSLIIPTALAVGQAVEASAREFLTAVAVAYEVTMRVGRSLGSGLWRGGMNGLFNSLAQLGPAVAAGRLYGLEPAQLRAMFSLVAMDEGSQSPSQAKHDVPASLYVPPLKSNYGALAQLGIWAALKARAGLAGRPGLLESSLNDWCRAGLASTEFESLGAGLRSEYVIPRMSFKANPCCWLSQPALTAVRNALAGRHLDARQVARIRIIGVPRLQRAECSTMFEAQFSMASVVALATSGIVPGPGWYAAGVYRSQEILALAAKVTQESDPVAELAELRDGRMSCRAVIVLDGGQTLEGVCEAVKGTPENPLTPEERAEKWSANTAHLPSSLSSEIKLAIGQLGKAATLRDFSAGLAKVSRYAASSESP